MTVIFASGINTFSNVDIAANADGSFTVVWEGQNRELVTTTLPNGTEFQSKVIVSAGVYVQRFDASGTALSDPTELFLETGVGFNVTERSTSVAALLGGGTIVAYLTAPDSASTPNRIVVREFSSTGVETSPAVTIEAFGINTFSDVDIAANADGSFTVVWEGQNRELVTTTLPNGTEFQSKVIVSAGVYVQRFDASGTALSDPTELFLETGVGFNVTERSTSVAALLGGGTIVAYLTAPDSASTPNRIVVREFSSTGVETSPAVTIEAFGINTFSDVDIAANADGSFTVVWEGQNRELVTTTLPNGTEFQSKVIVSEGVYAQRFDAAGTALSDPSVLYLKAGTMEQSVSSTVLPDGTNVVAYLASPSATSGSPTQIVLINAGENTAPLVISDGGGDTASVSIVENTTAVTTVTATDADSGQALTYSILGGDDAALFTIEGTTGVLTFVTAPDFETPIDDGGDSAYEVVVEVSDGVGGTDTQALTVTVINVAGTTLAGGNGNQTLTGTNEEDVISGGNGNEVLNGGGGNDTILGGNGNDILNGGDGNDAGSGGNGNDVLNGGGGDDTDSGGNGDDILNGGSGDDMGIGGNGNDILDGGEGDDILNGGNGIDILIGGTGNDTVTGSNGVDIIVFGPDFGHDVITDFANDLIRFDHVLFANFAAVKAKSAQLGADTIITFDAANTVTLVGISLASLDATDFQFV